MFEAAASTKQKEAKEKISTLGSGRQTKGGRVNTATC